MSADDSRLAIGGHDGSVTILDASTDRTGWIERSSSVPVVTPATAGQVSEAKRTIDGFRTQQVKPVARVADSADAPAVKSDMVLTGKWFGTTNWVGFENDAVFRLDVCGTEVAGRIDWITRIAPPTWTGRLNASVTEHVVGTFDPVKWELSLKGVSVSNPGLFVVDGYTLTISPDRKTFHGPTTSGGMMAGTVDSWLVTARMPEPGIGAQQPDPSIPMQSKPAPSAPQSKPEPMPAQPKQDQNSAQPKPAPIPPPTKPAAATDWPTFLGPDRTGVSKEKIAAAWPAGGPKPLWAFETAGKGYGPPAVVGQRVGGRAGAGGVVGVARKAQRAVRQRGQRRRPVEAHA